MKIKSKPVIGLFGANGMAGTGIDFQLRRRGFEVRCFTRASFDIVKDDISKLKLDGIDMVVNAAGMINRRSVEPAFLIEATAVNAVFPKKLASICGAKSIPMIHVSTDCVFDGSSGLHVESDPVSASDHYGQTKLEGEPPNAMVIRTSLIGPESRNHYSLLCWFLSQTNSCRGFVDHKWNGITTLQFGNVIADIVAHDLYAPRLQHLFANDVSKFDLLALFKVRFKKNIDIVPSESGDARDMRLRTNDTSFIDALKIPTIDEQIAEIVPHCDAAGILVAIVSDFRTFIAVPAKNCAHSIGELIERIHALNLNLQIIVVDDFSDDGTMEAASKYQNVLVCRNEKTLGYGGTTTKLYQLATQAGADYVINVHGDLGHRPEDIVPLLSALQQSGADVVVGSRLVFLKDQLRAHGFRVLIDPNLRGNMSLLRMAGHFGLTFLQNTMFGQQLHSYHEGMRGCTGAFATWALQREFPQWYDYDSTLLVTAAAYKFNISEIPSPPHYTLEAKSSAPPIRYGLRVLKNTLKSFQDFRRMAKAGASNAAR